MTGRVYCSPAPTPLHVTWSIRTSVGGPVLTVYLGAAETGKFIEFADAPSLGAAIDELVAAAADYDVALETHAAPPPDPRIIVNEAGYPVGWEGDGITPLPMREPGAALADIVGPLIDPDCIAGKHGSCIGGPCQCACHEPAYAVPDPADIRMRDLAI